MHNSKTEFGQNKGAPTYLAAMFVNAASYYGNLSYIIKSLSNLNVPQHG